MSSVDVHKRISLLAKEQGLSLYELAKRSELPYTSLYNMVTRKTMPRIEALDKICGGLGITMSEFFMGDSPRIDSFLTENEIELIEINRDLNRSNREHLLVYAKGLMEGQKKNKK